MKKTILLAILLSGMLEVCAQTCHSFEQVDFVSRQRSEINHIVFSADGEYLATGSAGNTVNLYNVKTTELVHTFKGFKGGNGISSISFSPNKKHIAISTISDTCVAIYDLNSTSIDYILRLDNNIKVTSTNFSLDGKYFILCGYYNKSESMHGVVKIYSTNNFKIIKEFTHENNPLTSICFSPDGLYFAVGGANGILEDQPHGYVYIYKLSDYHEVNKFNYEHNAITSISFSPDGEYFLIGGGGWGYGNDDDMHGIVKAYRTIDWKPLCTISDNNFLIADVVFSPDGQHFAMSGGIGEVGIGIVKIYSLYKNDCIFEFEYSNDTCFIASVDFNSNGKYFAIGGGSDMNIGSLVMLYSIVPTLKPINMHIIKPPQSTDEKLADSNLIHSSKIWAVIVGIEDYQYNEVNCINDLKHAKNDAYEFANYLQYNLGIPPNQIVKLLDNKASEANILKSLETQFSQAGSNDMVLFYFSGHGEERKCIPNDYQCQDDGTGSPTIKYEEIESAFAKSKAKHKLLIADACRDTTTKAKTQTKGTTSLRQQQAQFYEELNKAQAGIAVLTSGSKGERSTEAGDAGLFTHYLLKGLNGAADSNKNGIVTVSEIAKYVKTEVVRASDDEQHPEINTGSYDPNMPVGVVGQ